jgi:CBS domain containing-hemolysin-like protein
VQGDGLWLAVLVAAALVAALASVLGRALRVFSRRRLELLCRRRDKLDRLGAVLRHRRRCRAAAEILQVLAAVVVLSASVAWLRASTAGWVALAVFAAAAILLFVEVWLPRALVHLWAESFLFWFWPVLFPVTRLLTPLVAVGNAVDQVLHRLAGRTPDAGMRAPVDEEIRAVVGEAEREGTLERDAREMVERAIEMRSREVSKIMTPRTDMVTVPVTVTLETARQLVNQGAHSRVPVHGENRDDIVGILYVRDLLAKLGSDNGQPMTVDHIMRSPYFVPETKSVPALLQEFQRHYVQIAIVLDEYGGVSGLVTIEDILEEIVGEIADEYEEAPPETIQAIEDNIVEVDARVHIDELNDRLGLHLPEDGDFDTVGGFVFSHLGRLPRVGEQFEYGNVRFTMIAVGKRRIDRLKLELERETEAQQQDDGMA